MGAGPASARLAAVFDSMLPARHASHVIPGLDGLRAFSIICVLISHLLWVPNFPFKMIGRVINPGDLGVRTFFVISGFLITTLLLQEKNKLGRISLKRFYFRRTLRIFPAYYAFLACVFLLAAWRMITLERSDYAYTLTYTFNLKGTQPTWWIGHTWSLAVEEQFYLLWPIVVARCTTGTIRRIALFWFFAGPIGRALLSLTSPAFSSQWHIAFPFVADPIATGALLALWWRDGKNRLALGELTSKTWIWLVPVLVFAIECLDHRPNFFPHPIVFQSVLMPIVNIGIAAIVAWAASTQKGGLGRLLNSQSMIAIGVLSYSLYLWQMLFLNPISTSALLRFPLDLVWTFLAALVSFCLIERPFNALRRGRAGVPTPDVAPSMAAAG